MSIEKITSEHLARPAFVYVRQSSRDQVLHHKESQRRQYGLRERARTLGWHEVTVIDDDLGRSGSSIAGRVGFQRLVATVSLGQAGAVFSIEVSRFARNNRDWYQLMDLCGLMNTLIGAAWARWRNHPNSASLIVPLSTTPRCMCARNCSHFRLAGTPTRLTRI